MAIEFEIGRHELSQEHDKGRRMLRSFAMAQEYAAGVRLADIAAKYSCSSGHVTQTARRHGLRRRYHALDEAKTALICSLYKGGAPIRDICQLASIDRKTIWRVAKTAGLPLRISSPRDPNRPKTNRASSTKAQK